MRHATWCCSFRRTVTLSSPILRQQTLTRKSRRNGSAKFGKHLEILPLTLGAKTVSGRIDCAQTMSRDATRAKALTVGDTCSHGARASRVLLRASDARRLARRGKLDHRIRRGFLLIASRLSAHRSVAGARRNAPRLGVAPRGHSEIPEDLKQPSGIAALQPNSLAKLADLNE